MNTLNGCCQSTGIYNLMTTTILSPGSRRHVFFGNRTCFVLGAELMFNLTFTAQIKLIK